MGRVADHLKKFHTHGAEHHGELAECYGKIAGFGKTSKSDMKDKDGESLAECLSKIADTHEDAAEFHRGMLEECSKVTGDDLNKSASDFLKRLEHLENRVVATNVSGIAPEIPNVRAVPRYGAREMLARPQVPIQFAKLVEIEED